VKLQGGSRNEGVIQTCDSVL